MRIQLCKESYMAVDEFKSDIDNIKKEIDPVWDKDYIRPSYYIKSTKSIAEAYICTNCGTELFRHCCYYGDLIVKDTKGRGFTKAGYNLINQVSDRIKKRRQQIQHDFEQSKLPEICPVCGMPLQGELCGKAQGEWGYNQVYNDERTKYWDEFYFNSLIDSAFRELKNKIKHDHQNQVNNELQKLELYYKEPDSSISSTKRREIQSNPKQLKKYIYTLLQLDSSIESLKLRLSSLYLARIENQMEVNIINAMPYIEMKKKMDEDMVLFNAAKKEYDKCVIIAETQKNSQPKPIDIPMPPKPIEPEYKKPGLLNKKKILTLNEEREAQYQLELQLYEQQCQNRLEEIDRKNRQAQTVYLANVQQAEEAAQSAKARMEELRVIPEKYVPAAPIEACPEKARQAMITEEIEKAETLIKQLHNIQNEMYAANVIYEKYWHIDALAEFYDYLMSGRCTSLEGSKGAYNLYERENRSDVMITRLSNIENSLARIERGQYRISAQLSNMSDSLHQLNDTMDTACSTLSDIRTHTGNMAEYLQHISKNSDVIAYNTAVTSYYSKINADLTNALGFMVALK